MPPVDKQAKKEGFFKRLISRIPNIVSKAKEGDIRGASKEMARTPIDVGAMSAAQAQEYLRSQVHHINLQRLDHLAEMGNVIADVAEYGQSFLENKKNSIEKRQQRQLERNQNIGQRMQMGAVVPAAAGVEPFDIYEGIGNENFIPEIGSLNVQIKKLNAQKKQAALDDDMSLYEELKSKKKQLKNEKEELLNQMPYTMTWQKIDEGEIKDEPSAFDKLITDKGPQIVKKIPVVGEPLSKQLGRFRASMESIADSVANIRAGTRTTHSYARIGGIIGGAIVGAIAVGTAAALGASVVPFVGTVAGGVTGVIAGAIMGAAVGGDLGEKAVNLYSKFDKNMQFERKHEMDYKHIRTLRKVYGYSEHKILMMNSFVMNRKNCIELAIKDYQELLKANPGMTKKETDLIGEQIHDLQKQRQSLKELHHNALEKGCVTSLQKICVFFLEHEKVVRSQLYDAKINECLNQSERMKLIAQKVNATNPNERRQVERALEENIRIGKSIHYCAYRLAKEHQSLLSVIDEFKNPGDKVAGKEYTNIYENIVEPNLDKMSKRERELAKTHKKLFKGVYDKAGRLITNINDFKQIHTVHYQEKEALKEGATQILMEQFNIPSMPLVKNQWMQAVSKLTDVYEPGEANKALLKEISEVINQRETSIEQMNNIMRKINLLREKLLKVQLVPERIKDGATVEMVSKRTENMSMALEQLYTVLGAAATNSYASGDDNELEDNPFIQSVIHKAALATQPRHQACSTQPSSHSQGQRPGLWSSAKGTNMSFEANASHAITGDYVHSMLDGETMTHEKDNRGNEAWHLKSQTSQNRPEISIRSKVNQGDGSYNHSIAMQAKESDYQSVKTDNGLSRIAEMAVKFAEDNNLTECTVRAGKSKEMAVKLAAKIIMLKGDRDLEIKFNPNYFSEQEQVQMKQQAHHLAKSNRQTPSMRVV